MIELYLRYYIQGILAAEKMNQVFVLLEKDSKFNFLMSLAVGAMINALVFLCIVNARDQQIVSLGNFATLVIAFLLFQRVSLAILMRLVGELVSAFMEIQAQHSVLARKFSQLIQMSYFLGK